MTNDMAMTELEILVRYLKKESRMLKSDIDMDIIAAAVKLLQTAMPKGGPVQSAKSFGG